MPAADVKKNITAVLIVLAILWTGAGEAMAGKVRMGTFVMDPMVTLDERGKLGGMIVEVTDHIAGLEGLEMEYVQCDFHKCMEMLEAGEIDLCSPIAYTAEREKKIDYTRETLIMDWGQIYARHGLDVNTILDLDGKKVVTLERAVFNKSFDELLYSFDVEVEFLRVGDYLDVFRYVQSGKADAMVVNRAFGEKNVGKFHVLKTPIIFQPIDIKYATPKGDEHAGLRQKLDRRLRELRADPSSEYHRAVARMFGGVASTGTPAWVYWGGIWGFGVLVFFLAISLILKQQVNAKTSELRQENEERREAERSLRESRATFKALVELTSAVHWEYDIKGDAFTYVSPQAEGLFGYPAEKWTDFDFWAAMVHEEDRDWAREYCQSKTGAGQDHAFIYRAVAEDGGIIWIQDIVKVIVGDTGKPEKLIGIMLDITEQKEQEARLDASLRDKEVLIKEVHHRVKNNLAVVASLSSLQARNTDDESAIKALMDNQDRVRAMALVHEQLYGSEELSSIKASAYIRQMAENLLITHGVKNMDNLFINAADISMGIDTLIPFGLLLNEALTNALKYAYDKPEDGKYIIELSRKDGGARLVVRDEGKGFDQGLELENPRTLGIQLINSLTSQLEGTREIRGDGGTVVTVDFPLPGEL